MYLLALNYVYVTSFALRFTVACSIKRESASPLLRGGEAAPIKRMRRFLRIGAAGEVSRLQMGAADLPGGALIKVALHFFVARRHPLLEGGARCPLQDRFRNPTLLVPQNVQATPLQQNAWPT